MRTFVLALAVTALAQPAFARDHSHHHRRSASHHSHHFHHVRHHHHRSLRYARLQTEYPIDREFPQSDPPTAPFFDRQPFASAQASHGALDGIIARHAAANGLPESLVHRVVIRESRYNPRAVSKGNYGLMQIRLGTARSLGYTGTVEGLLDPDTNMTYAVRYLAGAYRAAGGNHDRAVSNYARGYYYQAKRRGFSPYGNPQRDTYASAGPFGWSDPSSAWGNAQPYDPAYAYQRRRARHRG